ncbi:UNVERIFIED_CONTAM: hypothetical protein GTU68_056307 [Idotea baltica]|nr:hypothetical protein [Idotea baltica]
MSLKLKMRQETKHVLQVHCLLKIYFLEFQKFFLLMENLLLLFRLKKKIILLNWQKRMDFF